MINKWLASSLFFLVMFFEGIIFPSLFGFRESFLTVVFFVVVLLYYKIDFQSLVLATTLSVLTEFYWGLKLGSLVLPLLASAGTFFLLNKFFNIKSRVLIVISGVVMFVIFWETSILVTKIL